MGSGCWSGCRLARFGSAGSVCEGPARWTRHLEDGALCTCACSPRLLGPWAIAVWLSFAVTRVLYAYVSAPVASRQGNGWTDWQRNANLSLYRTKVRIGGGSAKDPTQRRMGSQSMFQFVALFNRVIGRGCQKKK